MRQNLYPPMLFVNCGLERHSFILFSQNINTVYIVFVSFLDDNMSHKLEIDVDDRLCRTE